jgi:hypothetical protein
MFEDTFPNTELEIVQEINSKHLIEIESVIAKGF